MKEKVAEEVGWILTGTAANDASLAEMRREGNAQAEELVKDPPGGWNGSWIRFDGVARCS